MRKTDFDELKYACWLDTIQGFGRVTKYKLLNCTGNAKETYDLNDEMIRNIIGDKGLVYWKKHKEENIPDKILENIYNKEIKYTYSLAEDFPEKLKNISDPPFGLFYLGSLPENDIPAVAIIGSRDYSEYGRCMADFFGSRFAQRKINVISGMASGIDGIGQRSAIKAGGKSYGILGCGVDVIYPRGNRELYYKLIENGGVISEYTPGMPPKASLFPMRNRIISALSDAVLVVEAKEKSGTLITVDMALEQGRDVYAVPGRCTDNLSMGCNRLLRQGAGIALTPEDIITDMGWKIDTSAGKIICKKNKLPELTDIAAVILDIVTEYPKTQDDIVSAFRQRQDGYKDISIPFVCQGLLELELKGVCKRVSGLYQRIMEY